MILWPGWPGARTTSHDLLYIYLDGAGRAGRPGRRAGAGQGQWGGRDLIGVPAATVARVLGLTSRWPPWPPPGGRAGGAAGAGRGRAGRGTLTLVLVGLEGDLEDAVAEGVAIEGLDGHHCLIIVGHGDESEAFALVGLQVPNHLHVLHGSEGPK